MKLIKIEPENLHLALKDVRPYLLGALDYTDGKYNLDDAVALIREGLQTLWVVYNDEIGKAIGCLVTELVVYPRAKALSIFLLGGEVFADIVTVYDELADYAKGIGASSIEFLGRDGWEKVLAPLNFVKTHIIMRKNL